MTAPGSETVFGFDPSPLRARSRLLLIARNTHAGRILSLDGLMESVVLASTAADRGTPTVDYLIAKHQVAEAELA